MAFAFFHFPRLISFKTARIFRHALQFVGNSCLDRSRRGRPNMNRKASIFLAIAVVLAFLFINVAIVTNRKDLGFDASNPNGIELSRDVSFISVPSSGSPSGGITSPSSQAKPEGRDHLGDFARADEGETAKLQVPRRSTSRGTEPEESSAAKDLARAQNNYGKTTEIRHRNPISRLEKDKHRPKLHLNPVNALPSQESEAEGLSGTLVATLRYGVIPGFEVYFVDVYIGTPPRHLPLILDTGSDLIWIQCFDQSGPYYDPKDSTSFQEMSCRDPRCLLVSDPDPLQRRRESKNRACPYIYLYGDGSNTTGNFALETFTVNRTARPGDSEFARVGDVMFGCGRWNGGISEEASGMLGLGRGPLSLASQFRSLNGRSFSYCLANRHSSPNASGRLVLGEADELSGRRGWNFTSFLGAQESPDSTYYYVEIKSIVVGGEVLDIPRETWEVSPDGHGGTIIDSGASLSYFAGPAHKAIREAFERKVKAYPMVEEGPFRPCYDVSGASRPEMPGFGIEFVDGAAWSFPVENYFIPVGPDAGIVCLAMWEKDEFHGNSIIGNYLQQDFHMWFDMKKSRLGYAPTRCADV